MGCTVRERPHARARYGDAMVDEALALAETSGRSFRQALDEVLERRRRADRGRRYALHEVPRRLQKLWKRTIRQGRRGVTMVAPAWAVEILRPLVGWSRARAAIFHWLANKVVFHDGRTTRSVDCDALEDLAAGAPVARPQRIFTARSPRG